MSTAYLAIDLTTTSADDALKLARETFPNHEITLDRIDADNWALDAPGLEWLTEYGSEYGMLIDYDHQNVITLCGDCACWLEYGDENPDFSPSSDLITLADSGLSDFLACSENAGYCAGCEVYTSYTGGGSYYIKQD